MVNERELVKETRWSRTFLLGPKKFFYESKILADGLDVDPEELMDGWPAMKDSERHDFVRAFQCKGPLSPNDERILSFLMQVGDPTVWRTISLALCRHSDREAVTLFLLARLRESANARSNYYQAAALIADGRLVGVLEIQFGVYQRRIKASPRGVDPLEEGEWLEFLELCHSLWKITANPEYQAEIKALEAHPSPMVQKRAETLT